MAKVEFMLSYRKQILVDLTKYGHLPETEWKDLNIKERSEIQDDVRNGRTIEVEELTELDARLKKSLNILAEE